MTSEHKEPWTSGPWKVKHEDAIALIRAAFDLGCRHGQSVEDLDEVFRQWIRENVTGEEK